MFVDKKKKMKAYLSQPHAASNCKDADKWYVELAVQLFINVIH